MSQEKNHPHRWDCRATVDKEATSHSGVRLVPYLLVEGSQQQPANSSVGLRSFMGSTHQRLVCARHVGSIVRNHLGFILPKSVRALF